MVPAHFNLYVSDKALPTWRAFRKLATGRGLSLSQYLDQLVTREMAAEVKDWLDADDTARRRDDRS